MEYFDRKLSEGGKLLSNLIITIFYSYIIGILSGLDPLVDSVNMFLVQSVIIIGITRFLSLLASYLKQPRVIFEIIGGILLGPTALGRIPGFLGKIFSSASLNYLNLVSNIGLILYLFLIGLELDPQLVATHAKRTGSIALVGMAVPFGLGVAISRTMYDSILVTDPMYKDVSFTSFYVFIGTAMSITAFPVLARLLKETGLIYSKPGVLAMGAAALNDAVAWCLLILAISIANAGDMAIAGYVFLSTCALALGLFFLVRPAFMRMVSFAESAKNPVFRNNLFALTICLVFLCSWTTSLLGVHYIFGSFLFGLIVPRDSHLFVECNERIEEFVLTIMLPLYFALSGLKTDILQISDGATGTMAVLVIFVATVGKIFGCGITSYISGMSSRESLVVAVLMNTRGLVEIIVLNLGLSAGVLNIPTFSVMVLMALVTTFMTGPIIECIYPVGSRVAYVEKEAEGVEDEEKSDDIRVSDGAVETTVDVGFLRELTKDVKIGVILNHADLTPGLLDFLYLFAPMALDSSLSVRAMQFIEPTNSDRDRFLGLKENDRLIQVEKKSTSLESLDLHVNDLAGRIALQEYLELLPMSMFCTAVGAKDIDVYRIEGDPDEFPVELKTLTCDHGSDVAVIPWRPSDHSGRFFWHSLAQVLCPVALVAQLGPAPPVLPTILEGGEDKGTTAGDGERVASETPVRKVIQSVLVVICGGDLDNLALLLAERFASKPNVTVTIGVASEEAEMEMQQRPPNDNFAVKRLEANFSMPAAELVARECMTTQYDLVLMGFVDPPVVFEPVDYEEVESPEAVAERQRARRPSATIRDMMLTPFQAPPKDKVAYRRGLGMADKLARSDLTHPEFGVVGDRVSRIKWSSPTFLVVLHNHREDLVRKRVPSVGPRLRVNSLYMI